MYKKIIIIILVFISFTKGKDYQISPVIKSFIVPGWGEKVLQNTSRARLFSNIELSLWTACIGTYAFSFNQMLNYKSFAVEHAGVSSVGRNKKYWVDIGNYIDLDQHNSEHLRWRYLDEIYNETDRWDWDNKNNMKNFESMRIRSDMLAKTGEYIIGAIIMNHILSAIDTLYFIRSKKVDEVAVIPMIGEHNYGLMFKFRF